MQTARTYIAEFGLGVKTRVQDYGLLIKFRLSMTVVFSSVIAFAIGSLGNFNLVNMLWLALGGMAVTGASNAFNQVLEKDYDKLMKRTMNRPLATGRMNTAEAILFGGLMGVAGIAILWYVFNPLAALLGGLSLLSYSFIYTPLKRLSPVAVFVGAIPGAMPVLIGWVAATGSINYAAITLFAIQFLWQFPHFWSIAWVAEEDYNKAGFKLLPSQQGKGKFVAFQNIVYISILGIISMIPVYEGWIGLGAGVVVLLAAVFFMYRAVVLFRTCEDADARKLMFASIIYLPVVLTAILVGGIF